MRTILLLSFAVAVASCAAPRPHDATYDVACSAAVPHKHEAQGCFLYSQSVIAPLKKAGATNIHRLTYHWMNWEPIYACVPQNPVQTGYHTVVAYTDTLGQNWIVDNERPWPKHTLGATMEERCNWFTMEFSTPHAVDLLYDVAIK